MSCSAELNMKKNYILEDRRQSVFRNGVYITGYPVTNFETVQLDPRVSAAGVLSKAEM